jgi:hypothetical protein
MLQKFSGNSKSLLAIVVAKTGFRDAGHGHVTVPDRNDPQVSSELLEALHILYMSYFFLGVHLANTNTSYLGLLSRNQ